jgi:hypothetical protein
VTFGSQCGFCVSRAGVLDAPWVALVGRQSASLEMIEEGQHRLGAKVDELQVVSGLADVPLSELQQETEGVAVSCGGRAMVRSTC